MEAEVATLVTKHKRKPTYSEVAEFMAEELRRTGTLTQNNIAWMIIDKFVREFTFLNRNGNPGIVKDVLSRFRHLTLDAVWDKHLRKWRMRRPSDDPGRQQ